MFGGATSAFMTDDKKNYVSAFKLAPDGLEFQYETLSKCNKYAFMSAIYAGKNIEHLEFFIILNGNLLFVKPHTKNLMNDITSFLGRFVYFPR